MPRLTPQQKIQLDEEIQTQDFIDGKITTSMISKKYGLTWKRAAEAIRLARKRVAEAAGQTTIEQPEFSHGLDEREEIDIPAELPSPTTLSLIESPPALQGEALPNDPNVLDGNKFYCGNCIKSGKQTVLSREMRACPHCQQVLLWAN